MEVDLFIITVALQMMGRNPSDKAIDRYWCQAGGSMSYEQFCLVMKRERKTSTSDLMRAFQKIDSNGDGFISADELQKKLTKVSTDQAGLVSHGWLGITVVPLLRDPSHERLPTMY